MFSSILITGGAGFIGSNFVHWCVLNNFAERIVVLDALTYAGNLENIRPFMESGKITFLHADLADSVELKNLFTKESFDAVVNFAAETHVDRSLVVPDVFVESNVTGTRNLLEALRGSARPARLLQVSTDEVYGDLGNNSTNFFAEESPLNPTSPYAASKAAADLLVLAWGKSFGLPVMISRCSNNYGPYQFPEKLIPYFFQLAAQNKPLPLYGDGGNVRDWLYVEDHCEALGSILEKSLVGEIYNVGGNFERPNIEIAKLILGFLGRPEALITRVQDRAAHDRRYAINASKIKKMLGWKPRHTFEEGIKKTFAWYRKNETWWKSLVQKHSINETRGHLKPHKLTPTMSALRAHKLSK